MTPSYPHFFKETEAQKGKWLAQSKTIEHKIKKAKDSSSRDPLSVLSLFLVQVSMSLYEPMAPYLGNSSDLRRCYQKFLLTGESGL